MSANLLTRLRFSVWRDFVPSNAIVFRQLHGDQHHLLSDQSSLQPGSLHMARMREDPFGGVLDENVRARLRELLVDRFEASQAPSKRRIEALHEFLAEAQEAIDAEQVEWTVSQDAPEDDEDDPYRINSLLALKLHLDWLAGAFGNQPGISVSVR